MVLCVPHIPVNHILKYWAGMSYQGLIILATRFYFWNQLSEDKMLKVALVWEKIMYVAEECVALYLRTLACFQNMW